jgi:DNA processing protein
MDECLIEPIRELDAMKKYPPNIYYRGKTELLKRSKVSIVGSRDPIPYAQQETYKLASALAKGGLCIVSGGAMGIDAAAHRGAGSGNTIAVLPSGIDIYYPSINKTLLASIASEGLILSQFDIGFKATMWSFVQRNELVVALGEVLIVAQADIDSGSMRSVEFALEMGKKIYVLPHRIGESEGTNVLLAEGKAEAIYDINRFVEEMSKTTLRWETNDPFILFCADSPTYEEAVSKFPDRVFEAELNGSIEVRNGRVSLV